MTGSMIVMLGCDMHPGYGVHVAVALALLSLAAGYFCNAKSNSVDCPTGKKCGKIVGSFIMLVSVLLLVCLGYRCYQNCQRPDVGKQCPVGGGMEEVAPTGK